MSEREKEPPWLQAKVDQRIAFMRDKLGDLGWQLIKRQTALLMTPLTEPDEGASELEFARWEHTCDNCGAYVPRTMWSGSVERMVDGVRVIISFGACPGCAGKE